MDLTTAFSGTGGAENTLDALEKGVLQFAPAFQQRSGRALFQSSWACDYFDESRFELMMLPHQPRCVFGDITDFLRQGFREELRMQAPRMTYDSLLKLFNEAPDLATNQAYCVKCDSTCTATRGTVHVAGTPCIAWSKRGSHSLYKTTE